jgi:hypothetical protein
MGKKMDYVVACDDDRQTNAGYMKAYGQNGIPTAFIVGKNGAVLWFGHPMDGLDEALQKVVEGKYDLAAAVRRDEMRVAWQEYQELAEVGNPRAKELGRELLAKAGNDVPALFDLAMNIGGRMHGANRDFALANEALDRAEKVVGQEDARLIGIRSVVVFESGKQKEGLDLAKKALALSQTEDQKNLHARFVRIMEMRLTNQPDASD